MSVTVSVGPGFGHLAAQFGTLSAKMPRILAESLNEAGDLQRTQVRRDLREQTGVKAYASVTKRTSTVRAAPGRLEYRILGSGGGLPIKEFPVAARVGSPVTATPWGVRHTFVRSFKTSGRGLLFARTGKDRLPVRKLYGPAVSKEIVKDETALHFKRTAPATLERIVMKRIARHLG